MTITSTTLMMSTPADDQVQMGSIMAKPYG
jgi:hypothetical protein